MKLRSLFRVVWTLILAVGLLPAANVFASTDVPSWGDPSAKYGDRFFSAEGNFTESGVAFGEGRPVQLDRWQVVFKDFQTNQVTNAIDKYDVFDLLKLLPTDNYETKNGYGLLPVFAADKIVTFVKMANGNPLFVATLLTNIARDYTVPDETWQSVFYNVTKDPTDPTINWYVRSAMLVAFSGGRLDHVENTPTNPFDPGQPNGIAYYAISPWPKINTATVQGDTVHIDFTTYGLNVLHHPTAKITNGTDEITQDFGQVNKDGSHDTYNGTWDVPVDQVTQKLGPLDKLTVIVVDGYGRTAQAPLGQNLAITYNWASDYTVPYTTGQPASFTQALVLTKTSGTAPDPADKYLNDTLKWEYSVDGGPWQPLTVLPDTAKVFDSSGKLKDKIVITTDMLNTIPGRLWGSGTHKIQVKVSATPGDAGQYQFTSEDSGGPGPEAVVTVTFAEAHKFGEVTTQFHRAKLDLRWARSLPDPTSPTGRGPGGVPTKVNSCGTFIAPVEVSNNGDVPVTTTLTFTLDGTIVIERKYPVEKGTPPPPDYLNYPLQGMIKKTFTVPAHGVVFWDVGKDEELAYTVVGYKGPAKGTIGDNMYHEDQIMCGFIQIPDDFEDGDILTVPGPLDVGMPAVVGEKGDGPDRSPVFAPNYAAHITVTPSDPEDYVHSPIDDWVGVKGLSIPAKVGVHLVQ